MNKTSRIYIAGHRGLVGSSLMRRLQADGYSNLITRTHAELDLTNQSAVEGFFQAEKPDYVFLAAAKVGGIHANNTYPAEFIYQNLAIQTNVIHASGQTGVKRLLFLGSSCIYPRDCPQPIKEKYLLTGPLEPTNRPYAVAKIAGIEMCWSYNRQYGTQYLAVMPTNLYGPGDNYDLENSHVIPALIRKAHEAKEQGKTEMVVWGSGTPRREFLYSDDMADACCHLMDLPDDQYRTIIADSELPPLINIDCGQDLTIHELYQVMKETVRFNGGISWDSSKPDCTPQKLLEVDRIQALGWKPKMNIHCGLNKTYRDFLSHQKSLHHGDIKA